VAQTRTSSDVDPSVVDRPALSISELYGQVDRALHQVFPGEVWVSGEVRSIKVSTRGHCYLDLVDPQGAQDAGAPVLNVVCWSGRWRGIRTTLGQLGVDLDAGLVVRVKGEVQFYKARGSISFILSELDTDALMGKVAAERARLVKALVDEGLFDRNRRIPVPRLPLRIGLVASPDTEGCRDFLGQLNASGMAFDVQLVPTQMQGREAPEAVASAIERLQGSDCAVVVVVRGGGSKADLATFDTEPVARAIAGSQLPVWTGIGHTGDQSVADEIANRAFITPTECGHELARRAIEYWEAVVGSGVALAQLARSVLVRGAERHGRGRARLASGARMQVGRHHDGLVHRSRALRSVGMGQVERHAVRLAGSGDQVVRAARHALGGAHRSLTRRATLVAELPVRRLESEERGALQWRRLLSAYDARRLLERGYSVTRGADGAVVRSVVGLAIGTTLVTRLADGEVRSVVDAAPALAGNGQSRTTDASDGQQGQQGQQGRTDP